MLFGGDAACDMWGSSGHTLALSTWGHGTLQELRAGPSASSLPVQRAYHEARRQAKYYSDVTWIRSHFQ